MPTSTTSKTSTSTSAPGLVTVPGVEARTQADAVKILEHAGFKVSIQTLPLANVPAGFVISQTPLPSALAPAGATVALEVSAAA